MWQWDGLSGCELGEYITGHRTDNKPKWLPPKWLTVSLVLCALVGPAHIQQSGMYTKCQWDGEALLKCALTLAMRKFTWSVLYHVRCCQSV